MTGPRLRTDVLDAYVFRRAADTVELLQLRRAEEPLAGTWQPVMGHCEGDEPAAEAMWRELAEETGLSRDSHALLGAWGLEGVHPFYLASRDAVMLCPRFAVEAAPGWEPSLDSEHDARRWVAEPDVEDAFMWPGQRAAIAELGALMRQPEGPAARAQRIWPPPTAR